MARQSRSDHLLAYSLRVCGDELVRSEVSERKVVRPRLAGDQGGSAWPEEWGGREHETFLAL